ncbi:MAG: sulfatase-like hydrolase/transferase [Gammaproteobacteria bacterium]|jgi:arylsulfatase A-like enzyme|nr:sulfatase-like hydrolase/transferase [Gammaproteobacteria bacterium]MBU1465023.1 sulfatase-like hydrolase/transferase [Gammaproteobacteria bacterium]MBU2024246.1 sulfatase-like hydrolase/transferase [Gammaproteobacteria bacterium]MBU2237687.1 sulfatase-like hydrolase/transferase [Gammaproteobacteria bacterium]MBU2320397.1 sulfatase-like hydrolase/transferase [Gammaproteobacteria bacterium]
MTNIIYIVADDLGYADLGCYGGREAQFGQVSPNIDKLADDGMIFLEGYANSPVCSPTRFALMTMAYQYRLRGALEEPINSRSKGSDTLGLPPHIPTLPSQLKKAGYYTGLMGKWHLGYPPHFGPRASGYDEFFGIMAGGVDYFSHKSGQGDHDLWINEEEHKEIGYLTDLISEHSLDFINRRAEEKSEQPFFLSIHYTAPHWPWETRDDEHLSEKMTTLFHLEGGNIHTYRKMIHHMDEGIGRIMDALDKHGMTDDTLIVFTSDNGGERFSDNWPLVGGKMDLTEGGIRVPWVVRWPGVVKKGSVSMQHCMTMDWSRTLLEAGNGVFSPDYPVDGVSLMPVLKGETERFERPLYWRMKHRGQRALRLDDWKYLKVDEHEYLFNITNDARERANLAKRYPDKLADMRQQWLDWNETMPQIPEDATVSLGYSVADMPQR